MRSHFVGDERFYGFLRHIKDLCRLWCSTEVFRIKGVNYRVGLQQLELVPLNLAIRVIMLRPQRSFR